METAPTPNMIPVWTYNLAVEPGMPVPVVDEDMPMSVRITMAALDPTNSYDEDNEPSTLRIIKRTSAFPEGLLGSDSEDDEDEFEDAESSAEEEEEEEVPVSKKSKKAGSKKAEKEEEEEEESGESDEEMDSDDEEEDYAEYVICTLSTKTSFQQPLDLVIPKGEEVLFVVTGSHAIHLSGNYVDHPFDESDDEDFEDDYEEGSEDELDGEDYDLSPDEDELVDGPEITQLSSDEEEEEEEKVEVKSKKETKAAKKEKESKKRAAEEPTEAPAKKEKKAKVAFSENLEQGPTPSKKAPASRKLEGGVVVEDRTVGKGAAAKRGDKVGMRYVGKLKNGNVFDSNTKGKPFYFTLGKGEVIRGWDVGVAGMAVDGERRIVIPAGMAYGKQKLPGIPPNSELTFDVKLVNIK